MQQFTSVHFKLVSVCSTPSLRSFPSVAFETVPMFILTDDGPLLSFQGTLYSASSFHASLLQAVDGVMSLALCFFQCLHLLPRQAHARKGYCNWLHVSVWLMPGRDIATGSMSVYGSSQEGILQLAACQCMAKPGRDIAIGCMSVYARH